MPRSLTIDFFKTEDLNGGTLDIGELITRAFGFPVRERLVDFGDSFVLLNNVRQAGHLVLGDVVRAKTTDLPDRVSRTTGIPADLGLNADEGIGRQAAFLYDCERTSLLLQRDREVGSSAFREGVSRPANAEFNLSLIFKQDALQRLNRMQVVRKVSFKVARPQNPEAFREIDPSAGHAIDMLNETGGLFIDIDISVGKSKAVSLARQAALRFARGLFGRRGEEVQRVIVSGREEPGAATEIIDMLEDRLVYKSAENPRRRRLSPEDRERILRAAHREHSDYLQNYRHAE